MPDTGACRGTSCRAPIMWCTFAGSGKKVPMDRQPADPAAKGAFVVVDAIAYTLHEAREQLMRARNIINPDEAEQVAVNEFRWYTTHFSTCPEAAEKRKDRR